MRYIFLLLMSFVLLTGFTYRTEYIDPTGTYDLSRGVTKKGGETYGYFGTILIKKLTKSKVVMSIFVCKGAPSYNSGSFVDTLTYIDNKIIYTNPESDQSCKITYLFTKKGVMVKEETDNYNFGCGFGHAVIADGFYKKTSGKVPIIKDLLTSLE